jgi:hypothetical protein
MNDPGLLESLRVAVKVLNVNRHFSVGSKYCRKVAARLEQEIATRELANYNWSAKKWQEQKQAKTPD